MAVLANDEKILLGLLTAVEKDSRASQRALARDLGIALGMANAVLKRCLKKGYVKVNQAPANRYFYYLTPHGFAEKARLTSEYLTQSFDFFRQARAQCRAVLGECAERGLGRVALLGASDLAEIMVLCGDNLPSVDLVGIADSACPTPRLAGLAVASDLALLPPHDVVVLTALTDAQALWDEFIPRIGAGRLLAPPLLGVVTRPLVVAE